MEASHRSIHPNIPGLPWWAALLIATTATAIGYAIDAGSGHKDLTDVFAVLYIAGCVVAVLVVRQSGVFTAVIQPPLILFCAVPGAYWLFHGGKVGNLKDLLINCGYPLIERFPLMLGTAGGVLLIGLIRWYFGLTHRATNSTDDVAVPPAPPRPPRQSPSSAASPRNWPRFWAATPTTRTRVRPPMPSGSRRSTVAAGRPAALGPPNDPPEAAPAILEPRWSRTTKRRPSRGGTEAAVARLPPAISNPTSRPVGRAAAPGRRATMTRTPSRRGKCLAIPTGVAMATSGRPVAASIPTPTTGRTSRTSRTSRRAVVPRTVPARHTTRSRKSATAGQHRATNVETRTTTSPEPSAEVDRAHPVGPRAGPRPNPGSTTSSQIDPVGSPVPG